MPSKRTDLEVLTLHSMAVESGCVLWTGCKDQDGYGKVSRSKSPLGRFHLAHRLSYALHVGRITDGYELDHKCRVTSCINPEHLEPVLHAVNVQRGIYVSNNHRNTRKTHCIRGHSLSGENLLLEIWNGRTSRKCRACKNIRQNARYRMMAERGHIIREV